MTYQEALTFKESKLDLIGQVDDKGFRIDAIIIVPSDEAQRNQFFLQYLYTEDESVDCNLKVYHP